MNKIVIKKRVLDCVMEWQKNIEWSMFIYKLYLIFVLSETINGLPNKKITNMKKIIPLVFGISSVILLSYLIPTYPTLIALISFGWGIGYMKEKEQF